MERDLTTGNVFKTVVYFSLPYLLSYFLQTLYGMADLFIVGQFGRVSSTTAVSIGSQIMHMLTVMLVGLAMGATVMIGRCIGAKDCKKASEAIGNTVTMFMGIALVLMVVLIAAVRPIVSVMSTPAEAVEGTIRYLTICFIGIPFITAYNIISAIFRGIGDSKSPMYFIAIACVANIGLDYLFIGAMGLDAAGAALGTTIAQAISVIIALSVIVKRGTGIKMVKSDFRPKAYTMKNILKVGVPVALQDGFIQISFLIITIIANSRGLNDAAAVGIVEKIISFLFLVPSSMLSTVSALGAQNIGAGKQERAKQTLRYATIITVCFGLIVAVLMQFFAQPVVALFTDGTTADGAKTILLGEQYLRGYVWDCMFAGIHFSFSGYFCACGKSMLSFIHNILAILLVRVPGVYLTSLLFPETLFPMGLATAAGSLLSAVVCVIFFKTILNRNTPVALKN